MGGTKGAFTLIVSFVFTVFSQSALADPEYDIVIRNGRVIDGAGNPWINADLAIKDGKIVKFGMVSGIGKREIDASGKYVSPGWIDMLDQSGAALLENGRAENKLRMGVTTAIAGETGIPVPAEQVSAYFKQLQEQGISLNFGSYYSSAQARTETMGDGAGAPDLEQLEVMKSRVATAMKAGALGLSASLIYPPASFQSTEELIELASVAGAYGGIYATHMRDESADLLQAIREALKIGREAGTSVEIFHLKAAYEPLWGKLMPEAGRLIDAAREDGVNVSANIYPYPAGGTWLRITVPNWVFAEGLDKGIEKLRDPKIRARLKQQVAKGSLPGWTNLVEASGGWSGVVLANAYNPEYDQYRYDSIAEIAKRLKRHPADVAWDIIVEAAPETPTALFFMMDEADIETALKFSWTSVGSDGSAAVDPGGMDALGLPHPRSYGTFPRIIAEYVRERGVISLPEAIRKMSGWPARRMNLENRGLIREGFQADLVIFDFSEIRDTATWQDPTASPEGVDYVIVNGGIVIENGKHTGALPGQIIKGPAIRM